MFLAICIVYWRCVSRFAPFNVCASMRVRVCLASTRTYLVLVFRDCEQFVMFSPVCVLYMVDSGKACLIKTVDAYSQ